MQAVKQFHVFGEQVEILISSSDVRGSFSMVVQTCAPGGGPPPHRHDNEDEIFRALEGEFELFDGKQWTKLPAGEYAYCLRGSVHTFRNCGDTLGRMQAIVIPGSFDAYLEAISPLNMPQDAEQLGKISARYGIPFVIHEPPQEAPL